MVIHSLNKHFPDACFFQAVCPVLRTRRRKGLLPSESSRASERDAEVGCYSLGSGTDSSHATQGMGRSEKGLPREADI